MKNRRMHGRNKWHNNPSTMLYDNKLVTRINIYMLCCHHFRYLFSRKSNIPQAFGSSHRISVVLVARTTYHLTIVPHYITIATSYTSRDICCTSFLNLVRLNKLSFFKSLAITFIKQRSILEVSLW